MGFFARLLARDGTAAPMPEKLMSDAQQAQLADAKSMLDAAVAANPGALPDFTGLQPEEIQAAAAADAAEAQRMMQAATGIDAPGVIRAVRQTGASDLGGGREVAIDVTIQPAGREPIDTQILQHVLPAQIDRLAVGGAVTVRYDPDHPTAALLVDW
jgi:hypothetical protein